MAQETRQEQERMTEEQSGQTEEQIRYEVSKGDDKVMTASEIAAEVEGAMGGAAAGSREAGSQGGVTGRLQEQANHLADRVRGSARQATTRMSMTARAKAHHQKKMVLEQASQQAEQMRHLMASRIHETAEQVRHRAALPEAAIIDRAADRIDDMASYMEDREFKQMKGDLESRIREAPLMALAMALLVGYLLGNLMRRG